MTAEAIATKSSSAARAFGNRLASALAAAGRILFFSLADDRISGRKGLSVSIDKGSVSVASGSRFLSRVSVRSAKNFPFERSSYPDPEVCASAVAVAVAEAPAKKAVVTLSVPKEWTIATVAEVPSTIRENVHDAIRHELDRLTPFSADEALYDFRILHESEGKLSVLVLAVKTSLVTPYLDALRDKGITVSRVSSHISSLGTLCAFSSSLQDCIVLRDRDNSYEGVLYLDRTARSVFALAKPDAPPGHIGEPLLQELTSFARELKAHGRDPRIVLSAGTAGQPLRELLERQTGIPVIPAEDLMREGLIPQQDRVPLLTAYSGLIELLWPKASALDLLSRGVRRKQRAPLLLTIALACAVTAASVAYLYAPLELEKRRSAEVDRMIAARKDEVRKTEELKKQAEALAAEIQVIRSFRDKPLAINIVREVTAVLPNSAWLTRLKVSETQVDIEGFAGSATELIPKLEASKYLSRAELASATYRDQRTNQDRFVIKAQIEGSKKEETGKQNSPGEAAHEKK